MNFDLLIAEGKLGFYKSCEVTEIFLINKKDNAILNLYTLVYFKDSEYKSKNNEYLTDKPKKINKNYSLCFQKYHLTLEEAKDRFTSLQNNIWIDSENEKYVQEYLNLIPKQFISLTNENRIKQILIKEDGIQSSYVLEFFNSKKEFSFTQQSKEFNNICNHIESIVGFNFKIVPERLGDFIFQFPITILTVRQYVTDKDDRMELSISWNDKLTEIPNGIVTVTSKQDNIVLGNSTKILKDFDKEEFIFSNFSYDGIETTIYNLNDNLILYHDLGDYLHNLIINAKVVSSKCFREFYDGDELKKIHLNDISPIIERDSPDYNDYIHQSVQYRKKIKLSHELSFKQYKDSADAITDLQKLISENGSNGVYLWDPYLTAKEIFKTLYYSETMNVPLKAITSKEAGKIEELKKGFEVNKEHDSHLKLEVRMQHEGYGYPFHDRFLIFPSKNIYEEPKVYSLGTSVNSFGKSHHILQLISFPDLIIDAFNDLWEQLYSPECLVWKTF